MVFISEIVKNILILIGYMGNINSFPKPLSKEEEDELLEKYFNGDLKAKDKIIEKNLRLVAYVAKKYYQSGKDADDLISIGTIGLIKAVNNFNKEKGIRLATYAVRCIENTILT